MLLSLVSFNESYARSEPFEVPTSQEFLSLSVGLKSRSLLVEIILVSSHIIPEETISKRPQKDSGPSSWGGVGVNATLFASSFAFPIPS